VKPRHVLGALALVGAGLSLGACSEQETVAELRSLAASEDAVFLCRDATGLGHPFSECPDYDGSDDVDPSKQLSIYSLVSQTVTNEIAVVNVTAGRVVDVDRATPGHGFLRVGGRPIAMAASPGGMATFVTTSEVGRHGVFALATRCIDAPEPGQTARDLTSWPACRLNSAPGEITVLVEPESTGGAGCAANPDAKADPTDDEIDERCTANLAAEGGSTVEGRRKLVVSLPDEGKLVVIDAQELLNETPGAFRDCHIEKELELRVEVPSGVAQQLPPDLQTECSDAPAPVAPQPSQRAPQPAGFAAADDRLYVADQAAPVIHVIDTGSVCGMTELPSLLPLSLREPERVVTTRRVAVSPLTPGGRRYVYAIDAEDQPGASVMAFDVSPGSTNPTPIVRPGSPEQPGEKPDRLSIGSSARDVTFAYRDIPYVDESTGVAEFGVACDPNPEQPPGSPAAEARPSNDYTQGARPGLLRGLFGFVLLTNGTIAVVDVEDFDEPCRRPTQTNSSEVPDFRGCASDPEGLGDLGSAGVVDGKLLVTGEVSCRVVEPHRFRSATLAVNDSDVGVRAPSLRGFPQLTLPATSADLPVVERPRILAVPFVGANGAAIPAEVYVGSSRYTTVQGSEDSLSVDPNSQASERLQSLNSVILPPLEPRAYAAEDSVSVTYEGSYAGDRVSGFFSVEDGTLSLSDSALSFCNAGVYDVPTMTDYATNDLGLEAEQAAEFGALHADYVQITSALPRADDSYWRSAPFTFDKCSETFGAEDADVLLAARDFKVLSAKANALVVEAKNPDVSADLAAACFPAANSYRLRGDKHWVVTRASTGFRHDVVESGSERACVRSCSPLRKWAKGRVFEISSSSCTSTADAEGAPLVDRVGCAAPGEVACVYDQRADDGVQIGGDAAACIFDGITERFALYRGRTESVRDAAFAWQTTGGYSPLVMSLAAISSTVSPQSIQFLQHPEVLAVVDGSSQGLSLFSLDTFVPVKPSPFY
jgi:hypothetical protein